MFNVRESKTLVKQPGVQITHEKFRLALCLARINQKLFADKKTYYMGVVTGLCRGYYGSTSIHDSEHYKFFDSTGSRHDGYMYGLALVLNANSDINKDF